jgi:DNA-binding transcriptional LysR family regulator
MINLSIDLLEEFVTLARRLNFSSAAKELCMTQSSLSKHMMELERRTGLNLITRGYHIALTPAGKIFLRDITTILYNFEQSIIRCKEVQDQEIRGLRLQENEVWTTPAQVLYAISQRYKSEHPSTAIDYIVPGHRSPVEALKEGRLDCAIVLRSALADNIIEDYAGQGITACHLVSEQAILWANKNHPLMRKDELSIEDLRTTQIITSSGRRFDLMQPVVTEMCRNAGFTPNFENYNVNSITEFFMIEAGSRCVFLITPQTLKDNRVAERKGMAHRILEGEKSTIASYLIALSETSNPAVSDFMRYTEALIAEQDIETLLESEIA